MWKCLGMNRLGENTSWVRFAKRGKKQGINDGKRAERGGFWAQTEPVNGVDVQRSTLNFQLSRAGCDGFTPTARRDTYTTGIASYNTGHPALQFG